MNLIKSKTFSPREAIPKNVILPQQTHGNRIVEIVTGQEDLSDCDGLWTRFGSPLEKENIFFLGVQTADCAPIVFWNEEKYGIVHAGWRGICNGIVEKMCKIFEDDGKKGSSFPAKKNTETRTKNVRLFPMFSRFPKWPAFDPPQPAQVRAGYEVFVGPMLPVFEIQKDFCYDQIYEKFGDRFFESLPLSPHQRGGNGPSGRFLENRSDAEVDLKNGIMFNFKACLASLLPEDRVFDPRSTLEDTSLASWRRDKHFDNGENITIVGRI